MPNCDQKRPSCSQCLRVGKECHGYRDMLSMMFKNESDVVAKKAEKRYEALAKQEVPTTSKRKAQQTSDYDLPSRSSTHMVHYMRYPTPESLTWEIIPSIEEQAQGFFVSNYVAQPAIVPRGQFEWVTELLARPDTEEILRSSVNAASLAGLATSTKSPMIMQKAQAAYVKALRITNSALRVKATAVKDSTLISVIMLGMYENMVSQNKQSIQAWAKHVAGACALLSLRGKEQFKSDISRRIFHQFYGVVLLVALETGTAVHEGMHELYETLHPTSDYDVHGRQWTTKVVNVIHDAINLSQDKRSNPVTMVNTALAIDNELDEIKSLMPSIWHYETIYLEQPSEYQFGDCYHVYVDPWIAQMWNNLRSCRMYLYKIMRENVTKGLELYDPPLFSVQEIAPRKEAAEHVMRTTASRVVASVPQITGMIPFPTVTSLLSKPPAASGQQRHPSKYTIHAPGTFLDPAKSTGMVHLIWPVYAVGQSDLSSPKLRQWCIETLHTIALQIGTRQAIVLADELKEIQTSGMRSEVAKSSDCFFNRVTMT
ncbi:hypothetical protein N0V83_004892 [Neocucurbitaria cava]|uniref:Uncharacterized protein n=1 Tax=Neocucurbitaria cava TaxID=798079 RepID=A0A9W8Y8K6_9PLEO|nr:hypothetical protein N0V83_004892 [Neocucurbitaria cava]